MCLTNIWKWILEKKKRGPSLLKKASLIFSHMTWFWIFKWIFAAHFCRFKYQIIFYFSHQLSTPFKKKWKWFLENLLGFLFVTCSLEITSLIFYTRVTYLLMHPWNPSFLFLCSILHVFSYSSHFFLIGLKKIELIKWNSFYKS